MSTREELIALGLIRPARREPVTNVRLQADKTPFAEDVALASFSIKSSTDRDQIDSSNAPAARHTITTSLGETPKPPFKDISALHHAIKSLRPTDFVSHFLFEGVPYAFEGNITAWIEWKTKLASALQVDPREIVLIGSAALGFSLNPTKSFSAFNKDSDIDVGIVSQHHFEIAWRYLRQIRPEWLSLNSEARNAIKTHRRSYVFEGTIATDFILDLLPFGVTWQTGLDGMAEQTPTMGRDIKARIYRDFDSLRYYHSQGVGKLKSTLENFDINDEEEIPLEG